MGLPKESTLGTMGCASAYPEARILFGVNPFSSNTSTTLEDLAVERSQLVAHIFS